MLFTFAKNAKKVEKWCDLYLYKNRFDLGDIYYKNGQRNILCKFWKFQWMWTWSPYRPRDFPWIHPYSFWFSVYDLIWCWNGGCLTRWYGGLETKGFFWFHI
jgi:hypothetical protein